MTETSSIVVKEIEGFKIRIKDDSKHSLPAIISAVAIFGSGLVLVFRSTDPLRANLVILILGFVILLFGELLAFSFYDGKLIGKPAYKISSKIGKNIVVLKTDNPESDQVAVCKAVSKKENEIRAYLNHQSESEAKLKKIVGGCK